MPVQINEIIIKAVVDSSAGGKDSPASVGCGDDDNTDGTTSIGGASSTNDLAEQIFELIKQKQER